MATVTVEHVRALCAGSRGRTVLVLAADGPRVVTPQQAWQGTFDERGYRVLCSWSELLDDGLRIGRDGQLFGRTVEVCTRIAAYLNELLQGRIVPTPEPA